MLEPRIPYPIAVSVATFLSLILLPCLAQGSLQHFISRLRVFNLRATEGGGRARSALVLLALILGASPKLFALAGLNYLFFLILGIPLVIGIAVAFRTTIKREKGERDLVADKPWLQIEQWEMQLVTLLLVPLAAARAISLCGVFIAVPADDVLTRLPFLLVSALYLGMLKPDKRLFVGHCKRCKLSVPIVLVDYGSCIRCDERLLVSYIESLDAPRLEGTLPDHRKRDQTDRRVPQPHQERRVSGTPRAQKPSR